MASRQITKIRSKSFSFRLLIWNTTSVSNIHEKIDIAGKLNRISSFTNLEGLRSFLFEQIVNTWPNIRIIMNKWSRAEAKHESSRADA